MSDGPNITIGLKTVGDTSGADKVVDAIHEVEQVAEQNDSLQQQREARTKGKSFDDPVFVDESAVTARKKRIQAARELEQAEQDLIDTQHREAQAAQAAADVIEAKARVTARALSMQGGAIKNIGHVANQVGYQVTDFAVQVQGGTSALVALSQQAPQALGALTMLGGGVKSLSGLMSVNVGVMTPLTLILTELTIGGKMAAEAWQDMRKAQENLAASSKNAADQLAYQRSQQQLLIEQESRGFLGEVYKHEADELDRQARAIERINQLRSALGGAENQRASQEIQVAKQRGGDVALAEANALAVELRTGLDDLNGELARAQQTAFKAQTDSEQALGAYEHAINTHASQADIEKLSGLVDKARDDEATAKQAFSDTIQKIQAQRGVLLTGVEIKLNDKEAEYSEVTSAAAAKGFQGVYKALKTAVTEQSNVTVTKVAEVKSVIDQERLTTVTGIKTLAPTPQDTQAITGAVQEVGKAQADQGTAMIAALSTVIAGLNGITAKIAAQQTQINQLFARAR